MGTLVNGIKEIFATAKTTGSNVMLCGNDGTPDGHMTMANLASVLGDNNYIVLAAGTDFNDIEYNGVCVLNGLTFANAPESGEIRGILFSTKHEPARSQIVVTGYPKCVMYKRSYWNGNWQNWETVYDSSILSNRIILGQLASALGVLNKIVRVYDVPDGTIIDDIETSRVNAKQNSLFSGSSSAGQHEGGWYGYKAFTATPGTNDYGAMILFLGAYSLNFDVLIGKYNTSSSEWEFYKVFV